MTISNLILLVVWLAVMSVVVCEKLRSFPFHEQHPAVSHTNGQNISHYNSELQRRLITKERKLIEKIYGSLDKTNRLVLKLDKAYKPFQIADYIFTTGDEKGISRLFSEMINEGQIMVGDHNVNVTEMFMVVFFVVISFLGSRLAVTISFGFWNKFKQS